LTINSLDPVDIGALRTLVLVYDLRSFSAAAERLNVNQSTISYTVERLRGAFQDPLFVRQGNGVTATERCAALVDWARETIGQIEGLASPAKFDPAVAKGTVTISCNHHERQTLIRSSAPGCEPRRRTRGSRCLMRRDTAMSTSNKTSVTSSLVRLGSSARTFIADTSSPTTMFA